MMLYFARIGCGNVLIHSESDEKVGQESVTVEHFDSNLAADIGQGEIAVLVNVYVPASLQKTYRAADARLGKSHMLAYVNRAHVSALLS